jgi:hypothetical protein
MTMTPNRHASFKLLRSFISPSNPHNTVGSPLRGLIAELPFPEFFYVADMISGRERLSRCRSRSASPSGPRSQVRGGISSRPLIVIVRCGVL